MIIWRERFNIYLSAALVLGLLCGCNSAASKRKKRVSTLQVHVEMVRDAMGRTEEIEIYRAQPFSLTVDKKAFLTEALVKEARVIDVLGGFALEIQFDRQGSWLLEQYTAAARGKHIAIFSQFCGPPDEKLNKGRWLAAPLVRTHITDGLLVFTPDASRDEAELIATGLNNVVKKLGDKP
ncbi:MAG TPA: hypothetical protein VJA21_31945 [Verrucomicrobiae bacterium]